MSTRHRKTGERALHAARGSRTFCHLDATKLKLQDERAPITKATCMRCAEIIHVMRVVPIELKLDPLDALSEAEQRVLDAVKAEAADEGSEGYIPHTATDAQALKKLVAHGLVAATGRTKTYSQPCGQQRTVRTFQLAEKCKP